MSSAEGSAMKQYGILRRGGWRSHADLAAALERVARVAHDETRGEVQWIRSYVLDEDRGEAGTFCVYRAISPEAIRRHGARASLPVDEIIALAGTLIASDDPNNPAPWLSEPAAHVTRPYRRSNDPEAG
jgi:Nickel responsive protein SCO4226-like